MSPYKQVLSQSSARNKYSNQKPNNSQQYSRLKRFLSVIQCALNWRRTMYGTFTYILTSLSAAAIFFFSSWLCSSCFACLWRCRSMMAFWWLSARSSACFFFNSDRISSPSSVLPATPDTSSFWSSAPKMPDSQHHTTTSSVAGWA